MVDKHGVPKMEQKNQEKNRKFFSCSCFHVRNYFISRLGIHANYHNREQFIADYGKILEGKGFLGAEANAIFEEIEKEQKRRLKLDGDSAERRKIITETYQPLHPNLYCLQESFLAPDFLALVQFCKQANATKDVVISHLKVFNGEIYGFPVFTKEFCDAFIEELLHFENSDMPKGRPNTMNNYGILLNELGFDEKFITPFRENYLIPITAILYPEYGGGSLDSHKAFTVQYTPGGDTDLSYHFDNAEVTINLSLGKDFEEGSLFFGRMRNEKNRDDTFTEVIHKTSHGVLHRGQHMHGALPISEGERYNLIIWMRSSQVRNKLCPMCDSDPRLIEAVGYGDGFTAPVVNLCSMG